MASSEDDGQYARECLESAARAKSEIERKKCLDMARTWTLAALDLEGTSAT